MCNLPLEQTFDSLAWLAKIERKKTSRTFLYKQRIFYKVFSIFGQFTLLDFIDTESQTENYIKNITVFFRRNDEEKVEDWSLCLKLMTLI